MNPQCNVQCTVYLYTTSEKQHHCSWTEVGSLRLNPPDKSIQFGDKKPQLKQSHPVERRGKDVSLHVRQHLVPPHMLCMTTSTTTSLLTHRTSLLPVVSCKTSHGKGAFAKSGQCEDPASTPPAHQTSVNLHYQISGFFVGSRNRHRTVFQFQKLSFDLPSTFCES